jgi:hypothetical protein
MAEGRMLKKKISVDVDVADLENPWYIILFTWGISHLDVEGRITGDPREYKALVTPLLDKITKDIILGFFQKASEIGLIQHYCVDGKWAVQFPGFVKNQSLRPDREGSSPYPAPPDPLPEDSWSNPGVIPEDSRTTPAEVKVSKVKLSKERGKKTPIPENFSISGRVKAWALEHGFDRLDEHMEAFKRKVAMNGYTYIDWDAAFMEAIRGDWAKLRNQRGSPGPALAPGRTYDRQCPDCGGSHFRKARPGETGVNGVVRCECSLSEKEKACG